jgi:sarcosine oxidase subunit beta
VRIGIIGGGVYGTAISYFLRRLGDPEVHLFERGTIASGSTGYSAGIIRHHYSNEIQIRLAKRGREIISELDEYTDNDGGFHANGYLMLAGAEQEEACRNTVRLQRGIGIDAVTVDPAGLEEYFPGMNPEGISVAAFESEAGFADPHLVRVGGELHQGTVEVQKQRPALVNWRRIALHCLRVRQVFDTRLFYIADAAGSTAPSHLVSRWAV